MLCDTFCIKFLQKKQKKMHFSRKNSNNLGRPSSETSERLNWVCHWGYLIFSRIRKKLRNKAVRAVKFTDPQLNVRMNS